MHDKKINAKVGNFHKKYITFVLILTLTAAYKPQYFLKCRAETQL